MNPRTLLIVLDLAAGVGVLMPVGLAALGVLRTWELYAVFVWLGALAMPTNALLRTVVPRLVEPEALRRANGRLDGLREACFIIGSANAGITITRYGTGGSGLAGLGGSAVSDNAPGDRHRRPARRTDPCRFRRDAKRNTCRGFMKKPGNPPGSCVWGRRGTDVVHMATTVVTQAIPPSF